MLSIDQQVNDALMPLKPFLAKLGCDVKLMGVRRNFAVVRFVGAESIGIRSWLLRRLERELAHVGVRGVIGSWPRRGKR